MSNPTDFILLLIVVLDLYIVSASRLTTCVRASAMQGVGLALIPIALWGSSMSPVHMVVLTAGTLAIKAIIIPFLLSRAMREANVRREVEPSISLHVSLLVAAALVAVSFWLASILVLPIHAPTTLLVPVAFATVLVGFLLLVSRRKAVTQVLGYLVLDNGIFIFGQSLAEQVPFAVELGILLDLLVGVFVMGIAIHHISREFDHVDTELLSTLKDEA